MRTEKINSSINFSGYKIQTLKTPSKTIEIYSLNSQDKPLIDRMLNIVGGQKFNEDNHLIGGANTKEVFRNALKKAKNISGLGSPKVMLAIENNKNITGILSTDLKGDLSLSHLAVWTNNTNTRLSLIMSAIKEALRYDYTTLFIPREKVSGPIKDFYRHFGFKTHKNFLFEDFSIDPVDLEPALLKNMRSNIDVKFHKPVMNIDLVKKLKLDE